MLQEMLCRNINTTNVTGDVNSSGVDGHLLM